MKVALAGRAVPRIDQVVHGLAIALPASFADTAGGNRALGEADHEQVVHLVKGILHRDWPGRLAVRGCCGSEVASGVHQGRAPGSQHFTRPVHGPALGYAAQVEAETGGESCGARACVELYLTPTRPVQISIMGRVSVAIHRAEQLEAAIIAGPAE